LNFEVRARRVETQQRFDAGVDLIRECGVIRCNSLVAEEHLKGDALFSLNQKINETFRNAQFGYVNDSRSSSILSVIIFSMRIETWSSTYRSKGSLGNLWLSRILQMWRIEKETFWSTNDESKSWLQYWKITVWTSSQPTRSRGIASFHSPRVSHCCYASCRYANQTTTNFLNHWKIEGILNLSWLSVWKVIWETDILHESFRPENAITAMDSRNSPALSRPICDSFQTFWRSSQISGENSFSSRGNQSISLKHACLQ
jgi:hypothetical protein